MSSSLTHNLCLHSSISLLGLHLCAGADALILCLCHFFVLTASFSAFIPTFYSFLFDFIRSTLKRNGLQPIHPLQLCVYYLENTEMRSELMYWKVWSPGDQSSGQHCKYVVQQDEIDLRMNISGLYLGKITVGPCRTNAKLAIINESGALRTNDKCVTRIGQLVTKVG